MTRESRVLEFQKAMGQPHHLSLFDPDKAHVLRVLNLSVALISEEFTEVQEEFNNMLGDYNDYREFKKDTVVNLLKELADLQYVISHCANTFGLDLESAFQRVHSSNMSKLDNAGNPVRREDGKIMKGRRYIPAYLDDLVSNDMGC